jgi:hypothetical protein
MSRPLEGTSGMASGITALPLQFRSTASSVEIRAGRADAGHAGGFNRKAADVTADLLFGNRPSGMVQSCAPRSPIAASFILYRERGPSGGLTTFDGGSTMTNRLSDRCLLFAQIVKTDRRASSPKRRLAVQGDREAVAARGPANPGGARVPLF